MSWPRPGDSSPRSAGHEVGAGAVDDVHGDAQGGDEREVAARARGTAPRSAAPGRGGAGWTAGRRGCPPSAPELERWAGTRIRSAGSAVKVSSRRSRATPARLLTSPANSSTGIDERTMRRSCGRSERAPEHQRGDGERRPASSRGSVVTSPRPEEPGGQVEGGQGEHVAEGRHQRRGHVVEVPAVAHGAGRQPERGGEHGERRQRPAAHRHERQVGEADGGAEAEPHGHERRPSPRGSATCPRVRAAAASTFWPSTVVRRRRSCSSPAWIDVDTRLPREPNTLPRSPMAAGTRTSRPGRRSKVAVRDPSTAPATRLVEEFSASATSPCRASAPGSRRRRAMEAGRGWRGSCAARRAGYPAGPTHLARTGPKRATRPR